MQRMKVLLLCTQFPYPPRTGFKMRVYQLARQLAARHDLTLLSYAEPGEAAARDALASEMQVHVVEKSYIPGLRRRVRQAASIASSRPYACRSVYTDEMQHTIEQLCREQSFDVVQLESTLFCQFEFPDDVAVVLDEHNIEFELYKRMYQTERSAARRAYNLVEYLRFRRFEQRSWRCVDGVLVCSEREVSIVRGNAPTVPLGVAPNGVDLEYFAPSTEDVDPCTIVFNGYLDYRPNHDAAVHLVHDIWPLIRSRHPGARLELVGRYEHADLRPLQAPGVTITGEVPDVRPHIGRATVVTVPIRMGGGTRLKVVEALAMGKSVVSTSVGCEGVAVRDREHLLIADDPASFAAAILDVIASRELRAELGRSARELAEREYSWDVAGDRIEALYAQVAGERNRERAGPSEPALAR